ncbi:MAG: response regulator [Patescibacteria group bacterium]|jgi:CheY-like chemotaxis protein
MYKIFIFEDDHFLREMYVGMLKTEGFEVFEFEYPPINVVDIIAQAKPDVIIFGILPNLSGPETIKQLQVDPRTKNIPCLDLGNINKPIDKKSHKWSGADDYKMMADMMPSAVINRAKALIGLPPTKYKSVYKQKPLETLQPPATPTKVANPQYNFKIMMFEDDLFMQGMYELKYQAHGITVVAFEYPPVNVADVVAKEKPDVISMGVIMPHMDGFEAAAILHKDPRTKAIPLFFFTNMGRKKDIEKGVSLGAVDYIIKTNCPPQAVLERVVTIVQKSNANH